MKKTLSFIMIILAAVLLVACKDTTQKDDVPKDLVLDSPLIFSKVLVDEFFETTAIEIYNPSDKKIDLQYHFIDIYQVNNRQRDTRVKLEGEIAPKGFFLVAHKAADKIKDKAQQVYEGRLLTGSEALVLVAAREEIDAIGVKGTAIAYVYNNLGGTLVRKPNRLEQRKVYVENDYIEFLPEQFNMLGSLELPVTEEDFIYGPKLTAEDRARPFYLNGKSGLGGGGVAEVTLTSYNDGDTPKVRYDEKYNVDNEKGTRLYFIDTPETQVARGSNGVRRIEEYGFPAANFTNNLIRDAIENDLKLEVQTMRNLSTDGGFGRFFGHLYVDGYSVSYLLLRYGLASSGVNKESTESETNYKGMTIESWMRQAYAYAVENKLNMYSDNDGDSSYFYSNINDADNVGNRPFFEKWYQRAGYAVVKTEAELKKAIEDNVKNIEIVNDIKLEDTLTFSNKSNIRINGFENTLSISDNQKPVILVENSDKINIENVKLSGGTTGIAVKDSVLVINGVIEFVNITSAGIEVTGATAFVEQGTNNKGEYIKEGYYLKFIAKDNLPFIKADKADAFKKDGNELIWNKKQLIESNVNNSFTWNFK